MAIDHIVALDCPPKRALGVQGIVDRIKARSRAESALSYARANGDKTAETSYVQQLRRRFPDSPQARFASEVH